MPFDSSTSVNRHARKINSEVRAAAAERRRRMIQDNPVYGTIKYSDIYHASLTCPELKRREDKRVEYPNGRAAFDAGHMRPCARCAELVTVQVSEGRPMTLTHEQLETLKTVSRLERIMIKSTHRTGLNYGQVAHGRGIHWGTAYVIIGALRKMGLVSQDRVPGRTMITKNSIRITQLGKMFLLGLPATEA